MPLGIHRSSLRLRPCPRLRLPRTRENIVEPGRRLVLVHVLRIHELRGEDLLRLHEHLLLAGGEPFLVVPHGEVPDHFRELEDVPGLHLVAVVLEAAGPDFLFPFWCPPTRAGGPPPP